MSVPDRDVRLYNPEVAAAFRDQVHQRTRPLSAQRRFLNQIVQALEGKTPDHFSGIEVEKAAVVLDWQRTNQHWDIVQEICDAIPAICWVPAVDSCLGIFSSQLLS